MRRFLTYSVIIVVILVAAFVYCRKVYFFNPLTFHNDSVINLPFKEYKNPLYIEYDFVKSNKDGPNLSQFYRSVTTNRAEILQVIGDLRSVSNSSVQPNHRMLGNAGMDYIFLRQQVFSTPRPPSPILLQVQIYTDQHVMEILQPNGNPPVVRNIPQSLMSLLEEEEVKSVKDQ